MELLLRVVDAHAHAHDEVRALALAEEVARRELGARRDVLDDAGEGLASRRRRARSPSRPTRIPASSACGTNTSTYGCVGVRRASPRARPAPTSSPGSTCTSRTSPGACARSDVAREALIGERLARGRASRRARAHASAPRCELRAAATRDAARATCARRSCARPRRPRDRPPPARWSPRPREHARARRSS